MKLHRSGELTRRAAAAVAALEACRLCPRECGVNRLAGELGACGTGCLVRVSAFDLHWGEEDPLVGAGGSGTIFVSRCNLGCVFCQNWDVSRGPEQGGEEGVEVAPNQLAWMMLELQRMGAENVNVVSPSHVVPQLLEAIVLAVEDGLRLPLVYNSGGYDGLDALALLDGVVDVYMPDVKFWNAVVARRLCGAADYPEQAREAVEAMHGQVGDLVLDARGVAQRGLLVRHLVMPGGLAGTAEWMQYLASLSRNTYVNVMGQYRPCGKAHEYPELTDGVSGEDVSAARQAARGAGLARLDRRMGRVVQRIMRNPPGNE